MRTHFTFAASQKSCGLFALPTAALMFTVQNALQNAKHSGCTILSQHSKSRALLIRLLYCLRDYRPSLNVLRHCAQALCGMCMRGGLLISCCCCCHSLPGQLMGAGATICAHVLLKRAQERARKRSFRRAKNDGTNALCGLERNVFARARARVITNYPARPQPARDQFVRMRIVLCAFSPVAVYIFLTQHNV